MNLLDIQRRMSGLKDWALETGNMIVKDIGFKDFKEAMAYVSKVGEVSEKHEHHPTILVDYNLVRLSLTSHKEGGLTDKDFALAEEIDKI
jgi:4a-hydroxytetrahydrobiopterin dehydratase